MALPSLIAETPNAGHGGRLGFRYLIAEGSAMIGDSVAAEFVNRVRGKPHALGGNYIGVSRQVKQLHGGRPAQETLVLVGVDTSRLTEDERARLVSVLELRLADMSTAVHATDWKAMTGLVIANRILDNWASDQSICFLHSAEYASGPCDLDSDSHSHRPRKGLRLRLLHALALIAITPVILVVVPAIMAVLDRSSDSQQSVTTDLGPNYEGRNENHLRMIAAKLKYSQGLDTQKLDANALNNLLRQVEEVPHRDKITADQKRDQNELRESIKQRITELEWAAFTDEFRILIGSNSFTTAARHFREKMPNRTDPQLGVLWLEYVASLTNWGDSKLRQGYANRDFSRSYNEVLGMCLSTDVWNMAGLQPFTLSEWAAFFDAWDKELYEKVRKSSEADKDWRITKYLDSPIPIKPMRNMIEGLREYRNKIRGTLTVTISVTEIHWGDCWTGTNTLTLNHSMKGTSSSEAKVTAIKNMTTPLGKPCSITLKAKLSDDVELTVRVTESPTHDNGTWKFSGALNQLQGELARTAQVPLGGYMSSRLGSSASGNKITLKIEDIPTEPELPDWRKKKEK